MINWLFHDFKPSKFSSNFMLTVLTMLSSTVSTFTVNFSFEWISCSSSFYNFRRNRMVKWWQIPFCPFCLGSRYSNSCWIKVKTWFFPFRYILLTTLLWLLMVTPMPNNRLSCISCLAWSAYVQIWLILLLISFDGFWYFVLLLSADDNVVGALLLSVCHQFQSLI